MFSSLQQKWPPAHRQLSSDRTRGVTERLQEDSQEDRQGWGKEPYRGQQTKWKEGAPVSKLHVRAQRMRRLRWLWYPGAAVPFLRGNWRTETSISYEENFRARINDVVCPHVRRTRVAARTGTQQVRGERKIWVAAFG